jgi:hypothetical protein
MGNHLSSVFGGAEKPSDTEANSSQNVEAYSSQNAEAYSSQNAEAWPQAIECALEQPNSTDPRLRNL